MLIGNILASISNSVMSHKLFLCQVCGSELWGYRVGKPLTSHNNTFTTWIRLDTGGTGYFHSLLKY